MNICFDYGVRWRYEFNNLKSGIVTFGKTKSQHFISMNKRSWVLGSETVEELYEYQDLGVLKNFAGSFSSSLIDNIEKTQRKVRMLFSANFDRRKVNPFVYIHIYIKFWSQACLPSLLFGSELSTVTPIYHMNWSANWRAKWLLWLTLLPTGGWGGFLSHTTIVLAATLKPLKLWLPNFVTSCLYLFATI